MSQGRERSSSYLDAARPLVLADRPGPCNRPTMRCAAKAVGQGRIQYRDSAIKRSGSTGLVR